ncbi:RDD family protein [Pararhodobacter sp.]|uniref:RDD family protein n=1 Tax=Pararhodobacter sp. TaxID=2127056 RepID=UPI002FDCEAF9
MMALPDPGLEPELYRDLILKRFVAWVVDLVITFLIVAVIVVLTVFIGLFFLPFLWIAVSVTYRTVMLANYSATPGMMLSAICLRHLDGRRPEPMTCLWHAVLFSGTMATVVGQIISVGLMLVTPYRQGLNDVILRTTMINRYLEDQ